MAAVYTAYTMLNAPNAYPPEWRQGFHGFARNYGDFMASWASVQGAKFVVATAVHEDPRYFPSKSKNFFARTFNAARFAVIDRSDMGNPRPALSNIRERLPEASSATPICLTRMRIFLMPEPQRICSAWLCHQ